MSGPDVSVVVLNYNGRRWLQGCFASLAAQQGAPAFETILADNASTDGSVAAVERAFPWVRIVQTGGNLGFAAGNNAGAAAARGRILVFLNNDTEAEPGWLAALCGRLDPEGAVAITTSRIVEMAAPSRVDSAGDGYLRAGGAFKRGHGAPAAAYAREGDVFGACGAAFAIRRDVFRELGGFDPRFFMVYEDVDLSYRARLAGYVCRYVPAAVVRHAGSATLGRASGAAVYYGQRNLEWVWLKNSPAPLLWRTAPQHLAYSAAGVLHYARAGRLGPALRGKLAALAGFAAVWRSRRDVHQRARIAWRALDRELERGWLRRKWREKSGRLDLPDHQ